MKTNFYLTVNSNGNVKVTKNPTRVDMKEVSIGVNLELPDVLFKRPQIQATINIGEEYARPFIIDADTAGLVKNAIEQSTGLDIKLSIVNPE